MDHSANSPVLTQHSSPPHTLRPHGNLPNLPSAFPILPETSTSASPEDTAIYQEEFPQPMMDVAQVPAERPNEAVTMAPAGESSTSPDVELSSTGTSPLDMPEDTIEQPEVPANEPQPILEAIAEQAQNSTEDIEPEMAPTVLDPDPPLPQPLVVEDPKVGIPDWVNFEEDNSEPTEEELKEVEGTDADVSALDVAHHEKLIYHDVEDPEQRPVKKLRLSWTIKGVRGTKEKPNYTRVMNSPAAFVDGYYWYIKFFPRGNNASHLSSYIKCSREPPRPDPEVPENTFKVFQGPPDANLGEIEPIVDMSIPATATKQDADSEPIGNPQALENESKKPNEDSLPDSAATSSDDSVRTGKDEETREVEEDWRISAQLGTLIYNPAEPRTGYYMCSEHQFNKHNDDWGWTNFHVPWPNIHVRQRCHRKPLLQNDTIAIDAYIRIFEDPTQALWWHQSPESEQQWDSKSLTGYFPMGTPPLYHSPGVAGLTAWLLLKPVRQVIESIDSGRWRKDALIKPQPLISQLQIVLFLMRSMRKEEQYVNVHPILETLDSLSESFHSVRTFWDLLRRSIELEVGDEEQTLQKIAEIFDGPSVEDAKPYNMTERISIPVEGVAHIQAGLDKSLAGQEFKRAFPKFLPIDLNRQKFDYNTREWKVLYNRVKLNEEIDLLPYSSEKVPAKYTLYGFVVHVGERVSGKFYAVLRPSGPGTKWLAFEDGDGNKVFSYTKMRIQEFEGLEGDALNSFTSTRSTAYIAMYIRTDCLNGFLPGSLEPFAINDWLKPHIHTPHHRSLAESKEEKPPENADKETQVEIYHACEITGRRGLLDMYNLRESEHDLLKMNVPVGTTFKQLRHELAESHKIDNVEKIRLWKMSYGPLGEYMIAAMDRIDLEDHIVAPNANRDIKPLCLWMAVLETEEDVELYGVPDPVQPEPPKVDQSGLFSEAEEARSGGESQERSEENILDLLFSQTNEIQLTTNSGPIQLTEDDRPAALILGFSGNVRADNVTLSSAADEEQESVAEAVTATMTSVPYLPASVESTSLVVQTEPREISNQQPLPVDTITNEVETSSENPELASMTPEEVDSVIAAMIAADIENIDVTASNTEVEVTPELRLAPLMTVQFDMESSTVDAQPPTDAWDLSANPLGDTDLSIINLDTGHPHSHTPPPASETEEGHDEKSTRPVNHIYGFIQLFDTEQQDFIIHSTFFAPYTADVKETVRKHLNYDNDREIFVWQREKACNTSSVPSGHTFETIHFRDGVDVIVGDVLSDTTKSRLLTEGKFVTPESLSRYIWMSRRRHPIQAFTGVQTINSFGRDFYSGPFLNGRPHGENGKYITSSGHVYEGPFVAGQKSGPLGRMTYQNGDVYTGAWLKDEKHGQGTFLQARTGNKYVGGFENGKRWGKGVTYWEVADEEGEMCQICYGEEMNALFYDCGHICACVECARQVDCCPICRRSVQRVVKIYKA